MIEKIIPQAIELERKLSMLPEGTFTDKQLDKIESKMEKLAQFGEEKKPKKMFKKSKK